MDDGSMRSQDVFDVVVSYQLILWFKCIILMAHNANDDEEDDYMSDALLAKWY